MSSEVLAPKHRRIVGYVRFSFFGPTDTRQQFTDHEAAFKSLYDEQRMEKRFALFQNLCLPSIRHQTDDDFKVVVMSSAVMPEPYRQRLLELTRDVPMITVDFSETMHPRLAFGPHLYESLGRERTDTAIQFRLDDDDAVSVNYIRELRRVADKAEVGTHITFPKGIATYMERGEARSVVLHSLCTGLGLANVIGPTMTKNIFAMKHGTVWHRFPLISEPRLLAYVRTMHGFNDSMRNRKRIMKRMERGIAAEAGAAQDAAAEAEHDEAVARGVADDAGLEAAMAADFPFLTLDRLQAIVRDASELAEEPEPGREADPSADADADADAGPNRE